MNKKVMRPLTEAEMQSINGGSILSKLFAKLLDWLLPEGKLKAKAIEVGETIFSIVAPI